MKIFGWPLAVIVRWTIETLGALETTKCVLEDDFEKEEEREENEQLDGLDNGADERVSFLLNLSDFSNIVFLSFPFSKNFIAYWSYLSIYEFFIGLLPWKKPCKGKG